MIADWIAGLGPWNWILLGLALLALEVLLPGVYLLWIGIAALLTGTLTFQLADAAWWGWQVQVLVFLGLAIAAALIGKRLASAGRAEESDQPLLNQRARQLVGRTATLEEPIVDGRGRVRLGDTLWIVSGPDLPAGTHVRIVSGDETGLAVEKA